MTDLTADAASPDRLATQRARRALRRREPVEAYDELRNALQAPGAPLAPPTPHWRTFFERSAPLRATARPPNWQRARRACSAASATTASPTTCTRRAATPAARGRWTCCRSSSSRRLGGHRARRAAARAPARRHAGRRLRPAAAAARGLLPPSLVFAHPRTCGRCTACCRPAACTCTSRPSTSRAAPTAAGGCCRSARRHPRGWATCWRTG